MGIGFIVNTLKRAVCETGLTLFHHWLMMTSQISVSGTPFDFAVSATRVTNTRTSMTAIRANSRMCSVRMRVDGCGTWSITTSHLWGQITLSLVRSFTNTPNNPETCSGSPQAAEGASSITNAMELINPLTLAVMF